MNIFAKIVAGAAVAFSLVHGAANAAPILGFSYNGSGTPVVGTRTGSTTIIAGNSISISISSIDSVSPLPTPLNAILNFLFTSTSPAVAAFGNIAQSYSGDFSITNGTTNYLSGHVPDLAFGSGSQFNLTGSTPTDAVTFTSDVIVDLNLQRSAGFTFTAVSPQLRIVSGTIDSFRAAVSGNFSAEPFAVPEPASLAILGLGLAGVGLLRRNRKAA